MSIRLKKYFGQCKEINCNGKRSRTCPEIPKRQNGDYKKCSAWACEFRNTDGRWMSVVYSDVRTRSDAERRIAVLQADVQRGILNLPTRKVIPTVEAYCKRYLNHISGVLKENTYLGRERAIKAVVRHLGSYRIDKLNPFLVENFRQERIKKDGVSNATVNVNFSTLRDLLTTAKKDGLISQNPCDDSKGLKATGKRQKRALTLSEIKLILDTLEGRDYLMCLISLFTGLRLSDVLSLQWSNIDFNNSLLSIIVSKTERQETIPISNFLLSALREYKACSSGDYLFHNGKITNEKRVEYTNHFRYLFQRKLGLKDVSFHTLRHSTATLLDTLGNDLSVTSRILGHSSINVTAGFYIHRDLDSKRAAIDMLEKHILEGNKHVSKPVIAQAI